MAQNLRYKEFGTVKSTAGCIAQVVGFQNCFLGQLVRFGYGTEGIIMGIDTDVAQILIVKENEPITPGSRVVATLEPFNMGTGPGLLGRIINPLGDPLDGRGPVKVDERIPYFNDAPAIMDREGLSEALETGIKLIDCLLPVGHGQRMLLLGDKMTGKTTILVDTIINQKGKGVMCVYCAIGKPRSAIARVVETLKQHGCLEYTTVLCAPASSSPGQQYLAPYAACSVGEYFLYKKGRVFIAFDDFTKHAWAYRELSLLMQVPPGRDSYPGDIFYLHSRMIERAAKLSKKYGQGAMTFIPAVELLEGDLTAYVPTNLVSMTDGQIVLSMPLFNEGFRPAVDVGLSVSRVGSRVQWKATKDVSKSLRMEFIQYKELLRINKLSSGGQSEEMREKMAEGKILEALLTQQANKPVPIEIQIVVFFAKNENMLKGLDRKQVLDFQAGLNAFIQEHDGQIFTQLRETKAFDDRLKERVKAVLGEYLKMIRAQSEEDEEAEVA